MNHSARQNRFSDRRHLRYWPRHRRNWRHRAHAYLSPVVVRLSWMRPSPASAPPPPAFAPMRRNAISTPSMRRRAGRPAGYSVCQRRWRHAAGAITEEHFGSYLQHQRPRRDVHRAEALPLLSDKASILRLHRNSGYAGLQRLQRQ